MTPKMQENNNERVFNPLIKFSHEEVEALLNIFAQVEEFIKEEKSSLTSAESSAKTKLKRIYARQILSHEKREFEKRFEVKEGE